MRIATSRARITPTAMPRQQVDQTLEKTPKQPHLTLIAATERKFDMEAAPASRPGRKTASPDQINELMAASSLLRLGAEAMVGIGSMLDPLSHGGDEQLMNTQRSDAAAIFRFFGEVLRKPAALVYDTADEIDIKG